VVIQWTRSVWENKFRGGHWNKAPKAWRRIRIWGGVSPPQPTRGSGKRREPRPQTPFQHFLSITERFRWRENAILQLQRYAEIVFKITHLLFAEPSWTICQFWLFAGQCKSIADQCIFFIFLEAKSGDFRGCNTTRPSVRACARACTCVCDDYHSTR